MRLLILTLLLVGLSFSSCKKKQIQFKIKGNVTALNNGQNIQGVDINVYSYSLGNNIEKLEGSAQTDGSGNYELNIDRAKYENLKIKITKTNYFDASKTYTIDQLSTEKVNNIAHKLSPKSYTRFIIKNQYSPTAVEDEFKIFKVSGKTDCEECCPDGYKFYHGIVDTVVVCANDGGTYMKFYWWYNGSESYGMDSVYNTPFQTIDVILNY